MNVLRYRIYGVWFVLRNWRYHHAHHCLGRALADEATDRPPPPGPTIDYSINLT
jgi:hypothetical protein